MTSIYLKNQLHETLYNSLKEYITIIVNEDLNETFYAFTVLCNSGFRSMGVAASSSESLNKKLKDKLEDITNLELNINEWDYLNEKYHLFKEVDAVIELSYSIFWDGDFDDINLADFDENQLWEYILSFFANVIINVFNEIKNKLLFNNEKFVSDLFIGIQFTDPANDEIKIMEYVSENLNSQYWHTKFIDYNNQHLR